MDPQWYLSFATREDGFLGACVVAAPNPVAAVGEAVRQGCNPGGSVAIVGPMEPDAFGPETVNRLLTRDEAEALS